MSCPNIIHIDRVLASVRSNPAYWDTACSTDWYRSIYSIADAASAGLYWDKTWDRAWAECGGLRSSPVVDTSDRWNAIRHTLIALHKWDDCAYMLDSDPGELAILAKFGDPRAILLLPACIVFAEEKKFN